MPVVLFLSVLCACGTGRERGNREVATGGGRPLAVASASDVPGCFVVGGELYGYVCDVLRAYAEERGRELDFTAGSSASLIRKALGEGELDAGVFLAGGPGNGMSCPLWTTSYVVLAASGRLGGDRGLAGTVGPGRVVMQEGFTCTVTYGQVLDSLVGARLYIAPDNIYELAAGLARGESDFLICEKGEAAVAREFIPGLKVVYEFDEPVGIGLVFSSEDPASYHDFKEWFDTYRSGDAHAALSEAWSGRSPVGLFGGSGRSGRVPGGISVWDGMIREIGLREGVDWRLLSAIAYRESRFRHDVVSPSGACGLMQIMPVTARHFKIDQRLLSDPRVNITLAAKLLRSIEESLGMTGAAEEDRLSMMLAAYNCGIGTVQNARRIAAAEGRSPDSWEAVSHCLMLMGDSSYACDSLTYRRFRGYEETLAFVADVKRTYSAYCRTVG